MLIAPETVNSPRHDRLPRDTRQRSVDGAVIALHQALLRTTSRALLKSRESEVDLARLAVDLGRGEELSYIASPSPPLTLTLTEAVSRRAIRLLLRFVAERTQAQEISLTIASLHADEGGGEPSPFDVVRPLGSWDEDSVDADVVAPFREALRPLSVVELLCGIGALWTRGRWELWTPSQSGPTRSVNLRFVNRAGTFATPAVIASYMARQLVDSIPVDPERTSQFGPLLCDPCCGTGSLLVAAADMAGARLTALGGSDSLKGHLGKRRRKLILESLVGVDSDPVAVSLCKLVLSTWGALSPTELDLLSIVVGDSLEIGNDGRQINLDSFESSDPRPQGAGPPRGWADINACRRRDRSFEGFDGVIMNPPYGRIKTHSSDYVNGETRGRLSQQDVRELHTRERSDLLRFTSGLRRSGRFRVSTFGELDWYRLFLDLALQAVRVGGVISAIVPSTFLADRNSSNLREAYVQGTSQFKLTQFVETANLFPTVGQATCIITAVKGPRGEKVVLIPGCRTITDTELQGIEVPTASILELGETFAIPTLRAEGWRVFRKLRAHERISGIRGLVNLRGELELTRDRLAIRTQGPFTPLIRGDAVERFRARHREESRKPAMVDLEQLVRMLGDSPKRFHNRHARLAGRQVAYLEKRRRLSFCIAEANSVVANSCNYIIPPDPTRESLYAYLGLINSSLAEWRLRVTGRTNHVNNYEIGNLPVPRAHQQHDLRALAGLAMRLEKRYSRMPFGASKDPEGGLEMELDAEVCRLFDLTDTEATVIHRDLGASPGGVAEFRRALRR
jgi:Alw26I/Eco31I/Esp3I family type II restriction m6 adenine DNA methyltransferase